MARGKLVEDKLRLFNSCSDLSIRRFDLIYKTGDLRHLCLDFDGYNDVEVDNRFNDVWKAIFDEWVKLCDNNTMAYYYQLVLEVTYLKTRYYVSEQMLFQIWTRYPETMSEEVLDLYIAELRNWKYVFNKENDFIDEIHRLLNQHTASKNKLSIKESELEDMQKQNSGEDDVQTLEAQAVILEQITGKNNIDIDKTSVLKWLEISKLANSINEQRRKNGK